ncbi:MAG: poly-gamma-glutamate biosynthesis protein PgsC [Candidatus Marinimicrobia bacterium]|nr:poly-gamma-glutamate biosynthesis protein PgsC [Candidatus Neomarinimicrobiota bacterium]MAW75576.1 poly-gamma-glutamate biosynthesis protein PgsC [Candidatus Neomarinimicrobiota bacterium]|tara:strand:- start:868 stop:1338 length:471 start_codon:yes stop_codon:yes gene_type:complete
MFNFLEYQYFVLPYEQYVYIAIGLGMVLSLLLSESMGVVAGGIIVPGYIALHLQDLPSIFLTFFISFLTYLIIYILSKKLLIYGKRRLILSLLLAFLLGLAFRTFVQINIDYVGFIIPGLIASWMDRQGVVRTISVILIESSIVHLFLMFLYKLAN